MKPKRPAKLQHDKPQSHSGFFVFLACTTLAAVAMVALLLTGEIQGEGVGPDIAFKTKNAD
jgi:hypothetical protein